MNDEVPDMPRDLLPPGYDTLLRDLKNQIRQAQVRAALAVNRELVLLYWRMGREILTRQRAEGWGAKVIDRLSADLRREFPEMKGFSVRNLKYMRAFGEANPDEAIVQEALAQITWYHNIAFSIR
jgi:predicted nuclease of restriction endonuclease-like (RecB) superfamily